MRQRTIRKFETKQKQANNDYCKWLWSFVRSFGLDLEKTHWNLLKSALCYLPIASSHKRLVMNNEQMEPLTSILFLSFFSSLFPCVSIHSSASMWIEVSKTNHHNFHPWIEFIYGIHNPIHMYINHQKKKTENSTQLLLLLLLLPFIQTFKKAKNWTTIGGVVVCG